MSISAIAWALKIRVGSPTLKSVLVAISNYADEEGCAWPSQARLASDTELSERAVRTALAQLEERGFIQREERPRRADKTRQSDLIRLLHQRPANHAERGAGCQEAMRNDVPEDLPERGAGPCGTSFQNHAERGAGKPSIEPSGEPSGRARKRAARRMIPEDWIPSGKNVEAAKKRGLSDGQVRTEASRFRNHHRMRGNQFADIDAAWDNWCIKAMEILGIRLKREPDLLTDTNADQSDRWRTMLGAYAEGNWSDWWGPPPGDPRCCIPPEFISAQHLAEAA